MWILKGELFVPARGVKRHITESGKMWRISLQLYAWFRGRMRQARQVSLSLYELRVQHTDCSATEQTTTEQIALVAIS